MTTSNIYLMNYSCLNLGLQGFCCTCKMLQGILKTLFTLTYNSLWNKNMSHSFCSVVTYKKCLSLKFNVKNWKQCICCKYLCVVRNFCHKKLKELTRKVFKFRNIHANKIGNYKIYSFKHCISGSSWLMLVYVWKYQRFFDYIIS